MKKSIMALAGLVTGLSIMTAQAALKPSVIYDMGGKFDKSFNQASYNGAEQYLKDTGTKYADFEIKNEAQREQVMLRMAQRGHSPIVVAGFQQAPIVERVAKKFPDTKFVLIDAVVDLPNVRSVVFKEQEGSFLVGALAALKSKTDTVSFIGGMDIPLIRKFACGYEQGAKYVNNDVKVLQNMTGTTPAAWNDPAKGSELARAQFDQGADVVYGAAGGTGVGINQAAVDSGKLAIGVDSNQNYMHPGTMLTSMVKRVDVAVYKAFEDVANDNFTSGLQVLGLKEEGVDWALDEFNQPLLDETVVAQINNLKQEIIDGNISVHNWEDTQSCTY
ncbi:BMP family ABC transporter substrate-binding protein [uncultured Endozoicomonas sp.]|uniref:BMP family lipoprotein n=1 Tax=uncultured Endozoicomonas sp. TaxID=432652 RepID=UPI00262EE772|nr:BMP family ABC transporter substrate-binding protein [uncultured Endozoicomonas sp.]